jgi:hypothetical protein
VYFAGNLGLGHLKVGVRSSSYLCSFEEKKSAPFFVELVAGNFFEIFVQ